MADDYTERDDRTVRLENSVLFDTGKKDGSIELNRLVSVVGGYRGVVGLAIRLGVSNSRGAAMAAPESSASVPFQAIWLTGKIGLGLLEYAAGRVGKGLVDLKGAAPGKSKMDHLYAVVAECGDVMRELTAALADGSVSQAQRTRLLKEIREARAALREAEAWLLESGDGVGAN